MTFARTDRSLTSVTWRSPRPRTSLPRPHPLLGWLMPVPRLTTWRTSPTCTEAPERRLRKTVSCGPMVMLSRSGRRMVPIPRPPPSWMNPRQMYCPRVTMGTTVGRGGCPRGRGPGRRGRGRDVARDEERITWIDPVRVHDEPVSLPNLGPEEGVLQEVAGKGPEVIPGTDD